MKAYYQNKPNAIENIGHGKHYVNINIESVERELEDGIIVTEWQCDQVTIDGEVTYPKVVVALIREKYNENDELAILRQQAAKSEEFTEFYAYCEGCKATAKALFE